MLDLVKIFFLILLSVEANQNTLTTCNEALPINSLCSWSLTCQNGVVISISGPGYRCGGQLPSSIGFLTGLRHLDLSINSLTGSLPSNIGNLTSLTYMSLYANRLTGTLPFSVGSLTALVHLDLGDNSFSSSFPSTIGNMLFLTKLSLPSNSLTGSLPSSIENLIALRYLELTSNSLMGSLPSSVGSMKALRYLDLGVNLLDSTLPSTIGNMTSLITLSLHNNSFVGSLPSSIGNLRALRKLELASNSLIGAVPTSIGNLIYLTFMSLQENELTGSIPSAIGDMTSLQYLDLGANLLDSTLPSTIGNMTSLITLSLHNNSFVGPLPSSIGILRALRKLELASNSLIGAVPTSIGNLIYLTFMSLQENELTGSIPSAIGDMTSLQYLDITQNAFTGELPRSLVHCKWLGIFAVDGSTMTIRPGRTETLCGVIPQLHLYLTNEKDTDVCRTCTCPTSHHTEFYEDPYFDAYVSLVGILLCIIGSCVFFKRRILRELRKYFVSPDTSQVFLTHDWGEDELGRNNHDRVALVYRDLNRHSITSWFDADRLSGDVLSQMTSGIDNTQSVVVFITERYMNKVNSDDNRDNCKFEFEYAFRTLGSNRIIPVVMEPRMRNTRNWKGVFGGSLGGLLYVDMTSDEPKELAARMTELRKRIVLNIHDLEEHSSSGNNKKLSSVHPSNEYPASVDVESNVVSLDQAISTYFFLSHDWGKDVLQRDNHDRVHAVNELLQNRNVTTWFDAERLSGNVIAQMTEGIDNTGKMVVFVTERYMNKVNSEDSRDNCKIEFEYAFRRLGARGIIPVVMEPRMLDKSNWKGVFAGAIGGRGGCHVIDFTSDDKLNYVCDQLIEYFQSIKKTSLKLGTPGHRGRNAREFSNIDVVEGV